MDHPPDRSVLSALVGDIDQFNELTWGRRPMHRATGQTFEHLLSIERIEALLLAGARRPTFRLVQEGVTLPAERSTRPLRLGGRRLEDVADVETIADALHGGATLVLQGLQRTSTELAEFCRSLERAAGHPVQANAYLTPARSTGLAAHSDEHDVFVLHVLGKKQWHVEGIGEVSLEAGDVLYIPTGAKHSASTQQGLSLHLTIGMLSVTYGAAMRRLLDREGAEELRRPLPLGYAHDDAAALSESMQSAARRAAQALLDADPMAAAQREMSSALGRRRPRPVGHLRSVLELDRFDLNSWIRLRHDAHAVVDPVDTVTDTIRLHLVGRRLTLPAAMGPAVDRLMTGEPVQVGQLPALSDQGRFVLIRRLLREVVIEEVEPPPGRGTS